MPFIDTVCNFLATFGKSDISLGRDNDMAALSQLFHSYANAGLFEVQFRCNIYRTYYREALA